MRNNRRIIVQANNPRELQRKIDAEIQKAQRKVAHDIRKDLQNLFR